MITRLVATYATSKRDSISDVFTNEPGEPDKEVLDRNILIRDGCAGIHGPLPVERTALYILETAQAFRTVHANSVAEHAKRADITPKEDWGKDDHAIMLPIQCIKATGSETHDFELRLIGLTLIYRPNLSKTPAETEALRKLRPPQQKLVTFSERNQFKAISLDFAVAQAWVDCHPSSTRRDVTQGDLMGAMVIRVSQ